ncbi:phage tail tape measure protein [Lactiplantibacillus daowaiensis]|uniref:Phage tail tape measure protein n=1 Tax=Lactiplantibacillus daowaiensis TaxID=2559918 RepID=A0ABW1RXV3_9LACO|nr:phage tail tape measure protein [Lactiplantibacillus daowaiensis]
MTEIRAADIGIGFNLPDIDKFKQLNRSINQLIKRGDDITALGPKFKTLFSEFDQGTVTRVNSVSDSLDGINRAIKGLTTSSNSFKSTSKDTFESFRRASQESTEGVTREQRKYQDSLNESRRYVKSLSDSNRAYVDRLKAEGNQEQLTAAKVDGLKRSHGGLIDLLKKEKAYLNQVENASGKSSSAYNEQATRVNKLRTQIAKNNAELSKSERSMSRAATKSDRLNSRGKKLSDTFNNVQSSLAAAVPAVLAIGAAFKKSADEATELQNNYTTIKNLLNTGGESEAESKRETKAMEKENNGFALKYGVSPIDMSKGGEELIRRGYNGKQELASHKSFLQAARASGDDYGSVVNYGASALEKFGYKTKAGDSIKKMRQYTNSVLNKMAYGADATATDFTGMGNALNMAGATSHSTHQTLSDTVSELGVMSNNGLDGTLAGTGLRKVLNAFASPYTSLKSRQGQAIKEYGIDTKKFYDKKHNLKSLPDLLDYLNGRTKGLSDSQKLKFQNKFFGATGQEAGNFLMGNTKQIRSLSKKVDGAENQKGGGYIANLSKKNMKSWKNQLAVTKQYLDQFGRQFAVKIMPAVTKLLGIVNKVLKAISKWPSGVKTFVGSLVAVSTAIAGIVTSLAVVRKAKALLFGKGGAKAGEKVATDATEAVTGKESATIFGDGLKALKGGGKRGLSKLLNFNSDKGIFTGIKNNRSLLGGGSKNIFAGSKALFKSGGLKAVMGDSAKGLLKTGARGLLSATPLDAVLSATELIGMNKKNAGTKIGRAGGSFAGGAAGAAIGTAILPGIGTILGGIGGTMLGTKLGGKLGKGIQKAMPGVKRSMGKLFTGKFGWEKSIGKALSSAFSNTGKFFTGKLGWEKSLSKSINSATKSVSKFFAPMVKKFQDVFKTIKGVIKKFTRGLVTALVVPIALVVWLGIKAWQKFSGPVKKALSPVTKFISKEFNSMKKTISGVWKWVTKTTSSVWKGFKKNVVNPVQQVGSAVGKWIGKKVVGTVSGAWNDVKSGTKAAWNLVKKYVVNPVKDVYSAVNKWIVKQVVDRVKDAWDDIKSDTKAAWNLIKKYTVNPIKDAYDKVTDIMGDLKKGISDKVDDIKDKWDKTWQAMGDKIGSIWDSVKKHTSKGLNDVIGVINTGIGGINTVVHSFGGSKSAIEKIPKANFATGTGVFSNQRRAITKPTLATLNDGFDSPETGNREMLIHPNGASELISGRNVQRFLEPGAEVLSATETKFAMGHFKKGTGLFSGVSKAVKGAVSFAGNAFNSVTSKLKTIKKVIANPSGFLSGLLKKPTGDSDVMKQFASGFYKKMKGQASDWWSQLWSMASGALDDSGSSSGLLAAMQKYGEGHKYVWGATGPDTFDCSGLVQYALQHAFGISYPHYSGAQISKAKSVSRGDAKPGDLIGNGEHIGVYAGNGNYYSAMSDKSHPNIGMSPVSTFPGTPRYGRVPGVTEKDKSSKKSGKASKGLSGLISRETGGMMAWIKKFLAPKVSAAGNPGGAGVERWKPYVKKNLAALHLSTSDSMIAKVLRQINTESGGNPKAIGGTDGLSDGRAMGLMQVKPGTFAAYGKNSLGKWDNGNASIYAGLNYAKHRYGSDLSFLGNGHGYAKGGDVPAGQLSVVGEKGWELIAPKQSSHVFDHKTSKKILSGKGGGSTTIKVTGSPVSITVQGSVDDKAIADMQDAFNESNDNLIDKIRELMGSNEDGGLAI